MPPNSLKRGTQMEKNIFQEIQDSYSLLTKLLIVLVDCNGNLITNYSFSGSFHFPSHFLNVFQDRLKEIVPKYKHIQKSIIFDLFPGFKVYMIPFQGFSEKLSFIISGFFLEEGTRQQVYQYIEKHEPFYDPDLLTNIPEFSDEEKQNKLEQLTTLSTILKKIMSHTNKIEKGKIKEFVDSTEEVLRPKASVANLLKKC